MLIHDSLSKLIQVSIGFLHVPIQGPWCSSFSLMNQRKKQTIIGLELKNCQVHLKSGLKCMMKFIKGSKKYRENQLEKYSIGMDCVVRKNARQVRTSKKLKMSLQNHSVVEKTRPHWNRRPKVLHAKSVIQSLCYWNQCVLRWSMVVWLQHTIQEECRSIQKTQITRSRNLVLGKLERIRVA